MAGRTYIQGRGYDFVLFLLAPLLALGVALAIFQIVLADGKLFALVGPEFQPGLYLLAGTLLTQAHIFLVFFRSHFNRAIFFRHPLRFTTVPAALVLVLSLSLEALVVARVLSQLWDIYHSSLQTFGLARIYDKRRGNDSRLGRSLDIALAHMIYIGPLLAGLNLVHLLAYFAPLAEIGMGSVSTWLSVQSLLHAADLRWSVVGLTIAVFGAHTLYFARLARRGEYRWSWQKYFLLGSTAAVSLLAWAYLPWEVALLTVNFFHAWQYFGIVWWAEGKNLRDVFRLGTVRWGQWLTLAVVLAVTFGYAWIHHRFSGGSRVLTAFVLTSALMHFWYDGFIWSVRRNEV